MFTRKKKAVFENVPAPVNTTSHQKSVSYDPQQQFYPSDKMSKSKMLSPPPPVPAPQQTTASNGGGGDSTVSKQLIFHCQLAHGSQTGFLTGFSSVRELYQKIADYYEFPVEEVLHLLTLGLFYYWGALPTKKLTYTYPRSISLQPLLHALVYVVCVQSTANPIRRDIM